MREKRETEDNVVLANKLRMERLSRRETQEELAKAIGCGTSTIGKWEKTGIVPSDFLRRLCAHWKVSANDLLCISFGDVVVLDGLDEKQKMIAKNNVDFMRKLNTEA